MGLRLGGAEGVTGVEVEVEVEKLSSSPSPMVDQRIEWGGLKLISSNFPLF